MYTGKIYILLLALVPAIFAQIDYCGLQLCRIARAHAPCKDNDAKSPFCENPKLIRMTKALRTHILYYHNALRHLTAQGSFNLPQAERMGVMVWSKKLTKLAECTVKDYQDVYDVCCPLWIPYTGQNIANDLFKEGNTTMRFTIYYQMFHWLNEHKNCPADVIKSYKDPGKGDDYSHFTLMVQDKSTKVGCAVLRFDQIDIKQQLLICNYDYDNTLSAPVYSQGPTASKCTTGTDKKFSALCSAREIYD